MKRIVTILIGIMLIAFGVGFLTLKLSNDSLGNGFNIKTSGDKLIVQAKAKNYKNNINTSTRTDLYLDIILPSSYAKDLNLEANLGSIHIDGLELDKLYAKGGLGDINIENATLKKLEAKSSLGGISIENVSSSKHKLSTDLGAINTKNIEGPLESKTNLGSINIDAK